MATKLWRILSALIAFISILGLPVFAQDVSGIRGVVTDPSGAAVAGASVELDNPVRGIHLTTTTDQFGAYEFVRVPPDQGYQLTFSKTGFAKFQLSNLTLGVSIKETQNAKLTLGDVSQAVEVKASASEGSLNTSDASIGNVIDTHMVNELPFQYRQDVSSLMKLEPGVTSDWRSDGGHDVNYLTEIGSVTGARTDQGNITLDGFDLNDQATGLAFTSSVLVSLDAVQDVRVIVSGPTADFGRSAGGQINLETRSGTNNWHGNLREYNRSTPFAANDWFSNFSGVPQAPLNRNQFGATLGGPIKKDKLFLFFDYEGVRAHFGAPQERVVPSTQFRQGQLGYVNSSNNIVYLSQSQVAGLDPNAVGVDQALLTFLDSRYPKQNNSNVGDGINSSGYLFNAPVHDIENLFLVRMDYNVNDHHKLFLRANNAFTAVGDYGNPADGIAIQQFPGDPAPSATTALREYAFATGWTWTLNSNMTNQFSVGLTRSMGEFNTLYAPTTPNYFLFSSGSFSSPYASPIDITTNTPIPEFREDFTYLHGKHTINVGADAKLIHYLTFERSDFNEPTIGLGGLVQSFTPSDSPNLFPATISSNPAAINDYDNYFPILLGRYAATQTSYTYSATGTPLPAGAGAHRDFHYNELEPYVQDTWRVRSDLTVSAGLRWYLHFVPYEANGFESIPTVNFAQYFSARVQAANAGTSGNTAIPLESFVKGGSANNAPGYYNMDWKDFAPRLGVAYNPSFREGFWGKLFGDRKTVIRAGSGIVYDRIASGVSLGLDETSFLFTNSATLPYGTANATQALMSSPRFTSVTSLPGLPTAPTINLSQPFTPGVNSLGQPVALGTSNGTPDYFNFNANVKSPYEIQLQFGFQRELPHGFQLEADYVGRLGRRLLAVGDSAQMLNFKDTASGQLVRTAFGALEKQIQSGTPFSQITVQPWFENQMNSAISKNFGKFGVNTCTQYAQAVYGFAIPNCTELAGYVEYGFVSVGDLSDTTSGLFTNGLLSPNVGLPAQTGANGFIGNFASSNYNGLLVSLRKKLSRNLQFDFNYTYSHSIDNLSEVSNYFVTFTGFGAGEVCDLQDLRACRASSDFDVRHQVEMNFVYSLPVGRDQVFLSHPPGWLNTIVGGWTTSGIIFARAGFPFTGYTGAFPIGFTLDSPPLLTGSRSAIAPGIHIQPGSGGNSASVQYFNNVSAALGALSFPQGGNVGDRNIFQGPGFWNVDFGLSKKFVMPWSESQHLVIRWDSFNLFNHPSFDPPGQQNISLINASSSNFGAITSTASAPRVMQFALRYQF